ncbi:multi-sensor signal transduction histidine kinase [Candidatus Moduliflexus flocculans]|uniref:histidine kinase n=1 Tax=Candidatus Moduliflexus flocculans TaxID=1499966 RepID=A0A081BLP5_9BACT|nr:multi-sensor signal transduction histidine kinase [Candidatus Moduliflexus flocculans]
MSAQSSMPHKVLIVDDKIENIAILIHVLERVGFELLVAKNGQEVFDVFQHASPDIILLDVMMPDISGFEVCRRLKANEQTRDIPVIFLSALIEQIDKLKGFELGAVDYITKPFQHDEVLARVRTHLTMRDLQKRLQESNQRLQERTNELEVTNKELRNFAYIVSHDLKAPLRGISQLSTWLIQDHGDSLAQEGKELLDLLINRVKRMDSLIDGILAYSRAGRLVETVDEIDLNLLLADVIKSLMPPTNIQVTCETSLPTLKGNTTQIAQVFQNLLSNAMKFMDKPEGRIQIGCREDEHFWRFWIADNGPGIAPQYHERIFQIFQTLNSTSENSESSGVGLSIVKKVIETYGGKIWVESALGSGSTFWLTYPKNIAVHNLHTS